MTTTLFYNSITMFKYLELFINNNRDVAELSAWIDKNITQDREELEHICDYFMGIENPNYKLSYKNAMAKAKRWVESMRKDTTNEIEWVDYEIVYKTKDWLMKFVKLLTKEAYENESSNMRHCIRTYWGNDREVFSLRDDVNMPHATMDIVKNWDTIMQIQGKWDNTVDGKYQQYNMEFLEYMGFTINSDFLKKIWYYKIDDIDKGLTSQKSYNGYIHESHIDTLQDSEWRKYRGMGLWDVHPLVDIDDEWNCRLFDDINSVFEYTKLVNKWDIDKIYAQNASSWNFAKNASSWDYAKNASSWHSAKNASSWDYAKNASSWDFAQNASSWKSAKNSSSWDYASSIVTWKYSITADIGIDSKSKWIIGTWIVLAEYDKNTDWYYYPKNVKCGQIDGTILKDNTWYTLKNGEFTEVI